MEKSVDEPELDELELDELELDESELYDCSGSGKRWRSKTCH